MSDNKLLTENTIRRFMKLANVDALTNNFIAENYDTKEEVNEETEEEVTEEVNEENFEEINEEEDDEEMELDSELGAEEEPMDMGDAEPEAEMGPADMSLTEEEASLLISLGERLAAAMEEAEPGAEAGEPEVAAADDDDMDMEEEPAMRSVYEEGHQDLVNEVLRRVTKRLVAAKLQGRK